MTSRIRDFLRNRRDSGLDDGPVLVVDLDVVRDNYALFAKALPDTRVFYAVKANPAPEVLSLLNSLGSCFDTASIPEIEMVLATGCTADRISYGNTIKKERDIARAYELGVRLYAVDCQAEVEKIARSAPGSKVFCRILSDCVGAEWPLSRKFGCEPAMAADVLEHAHKLGLEPHGVSFHVGSQQRNPHAWDRALASASAVFRECGERGINLSMVNLGGGFPTKYLKNVPTVKAYGSAIFRSLRKHFGNRIPETIIEPGRGMVGNAGMIETEVVLISKKSNEDDVRWVYLDIGKFGGLAETMDEFDPLPDPHPAGRRCDGALCARGPDLRLGRRVVREAALRAACKPRNRRQAPDRGHRRLHGDLRRRRLQRLRAVADGPHLRSPGDGRPAPTSPDTPYRRARARRRREDRPCSRFARNSSETQRPARRCSICHSVRRASRRRPNGCAKDVCRRRDSRSSHPTAAASLALRGSGTCPPARRGRRCCSGRSQCTPTIAAAGSGARWSSVRSRTRSGLATAPCMLVGDAPYYGRFGFSAEATGSLWLPGRYDANRFLAHELQPGALANAAGLVGPTGRLEPKPDLSTLVARSIHTPAARAA